MIKISSLLGAALMLGACAKSEPAPYSFLDTDQDRRISVGEMRAGLTAVVLGIADADGDDELTFSEISAAYPASNQADFSASDTDGSGTLSRVELQGAIDRSGGFKALMADIDVNGNSIIDPAEAARFHDAMVTSKSANDITKIDGIVDEKAAGEVNAAFGKMLGITAKRRTSVFYEDRRYRNGTFGYPYANRPFYYRPHRPYYNRPNRPVRPNRPRPVKNPVARPLPSDFRPQSRRRR